MVQGAAAVERLRGRASLKAEGKARVEEGAGETNASLCRGARLCRYDTPFSLDGAALFVC